MSSANLRFCSPTEKDNTYSFFYEALSNALNLYWNFELISGDVDRALAYARKNSAVIILPSGAGGTCIELLEKLLRFGYGPNLNDDDEEGFIASVRFIFVELPEVTCLEFEAASKAFARLGLGWVVRSTGLFRVIGDVVDNPNSGTLTQEDVARTLESSLFYSGAAGLAEFVNRDARILHTCLGFFSREAQPALRLLFGATAAGDLPVSQFKDILSAMERRCGVAVDVDLSDWLQGVERNLASLDSRRRDRLSNYLEGCRILFVEDQFREQLWDLVLPPLFGTTIHEESQGKGDIQNGVLVVCGSAREALMRIERQGLAFDIVLLDLYSSLDPNDHSELAISEITISEIFSTLLKSLGADSDCRERLHPAVVVLSGDSSGLSVRTMLHDLRVDDYIFKNVNWDQQKRSFYAALRKALVSGLTHRIARNIALPDAETRGHAATSLNSWLRQFWPEHRPSVVRMMRWFRYYSAVDIIDYLDDFLGSHFIFDGSRMRTPHSPPMRPRDFIFSYLGRPNKSGASALTLIAKTRWFAKLRRDLLEAEGDQSMPRIETYESTIALVKDSLDRRPRRRSRGDHSDGLCVVFVDDIVGSGGQCEEYLIKFIGRVVNDEVDRLDVVMPGGVLRQVRRGVGPVYVLVLYAIGWVNDDLDKSLEVTKSDGGQLLAWFTANVPCDGRFTGSPSWLRFPFYVASWLERDGRVLNINEMEEVFGDEKYRGISDCREGEDVEDFEPLGWKRSAGLIATYANVPGNVPPVLWGSRKGWEPLFRRFFNQFVRMRH